MGNQNRIGSRATVISEVLGRTVEVKRTPTKGISYTLIYRYFDAIDRWVKLSGGATKLLIYLALIEAGYDGQILLNRKTRGKLMEVLSINMDSIYRYLRELKTNGAIIKLGNGCYLMDKDLIELEDQKGNRICSPELL
jgi:hypothetical protein